MFNIHALREQWDLLTMASKLPKIIELLQRRKGSRPTEAEISEETSLKRSTIRRCKLLIELPQHHIDQMLLELRKPKPQQRLTEDFFIEMERSLKTVSRALPEVLPENKKEVARHILIKKFTNGVIENRVHFRNLAKIARAEEADRASRIRVLKKTFEDNKYSIAAAYQDSVANLYAEKDILSRINSLLERIDDLDPDELDEALRSNLSALSKRITALLEGTDEI